LHSLVAFTQEQQPFWNEIQNFRKQDSVQLPSKGAILFVGSSSFRLWNNVAQAFPGHAIINRGFGGSSLVHVIQYADDIIFPYQPSQIVIYCGENDLTDEKVTGDMVYQRFMGLYSLIQAKLPAASVVFVSIKPSPSRWHLKDKMVQANSRIKKFLTGKKNTAFVDIWNAMLKDGRPNEDLFIEDRLHMNEKGYAIWQQHIAPYLRKEK
jgi:lysophospholipase L1-like esterase